MHNRWIVGVVTAAVIGLGLAHGWAPVRGAGEPPNHSPAARGRETILVRGQAVPLPDPPPELAVPETIAMAAATDRITPEDACRLCGPAGAREAPARRPLRRFLAGRLQRVGRIVAVPLRWVRR